MADGILTNIDGTFTQNNSLRGISVTTLPDIALDAAQTIGNYAQTADDLLKAYPNRFLGRASTVQTKPTDTAAANAVAAQQSKPNAINMRVRLKAQPGAAANVYGPGPKDPNNILSILYETDGLLFPYTPTINYVQNVEYKSLDMTHTNQDWFSYARTPSTDLTVTGDFTIQNQREGLYTLAVVHFLRTVSKMHFGQTDKNAGLPPPVLLFTGYGNYMFNDLPVILKNHSYALDKNVDMVDVHTGTGGYARLPSYFQITMQLTVQNTPKRLRTEFNLDKFRTGELMSGSNKGWI